MKAVWKKRWLKALRSGEYAQGVGTLRRTDEGPDQQFCCLGVLCDIANVRWSKTGSCKFGRDDLNPFGLEFFGLNDEDQELCVSLNDDVGRSFKQIARTIETKF